MILAGVLGVLAGIAGFSPLLLARHLARRGSQKVREQSIPIALGLVVLSLALLFLVLFAASRIAADTFFVFGVSLVAAFFCATMVLVAAELRQK